MFLLEGKNKRHPMNLWQPFKRWNEKIPCVDFEGKRRRKVMSCVCEDQFWRLAAWYLAYPSQIWLRESQSWGWLIPNVPSISVCAFFMFVFLFIIHTEDRNTHFTHKLRTFCEVKKWSSQIEIPVWGLNCGFKFKVRIGFRSGIDSGLKG